MISKKELAAYIIHKEATDMTKDSGIDPSDIRWDNTVAKNFCKICIGADRYALSSTTVGIACEILGLVNKDTKEYLASRGGVVIAAVDPLSGNLINLSLREILDLLPDEIERHNAVYNPDERIGMIITFLQSGSPVEIVEDDNDSSDFIIAYDPKKDGDGNA